MVDYTHGNNQTQTIMFSQSGELISTEGSQRSLRDTSIHDTRSVVEWPTKSKSQVAASVKEQAMQDAARDTQSMPERQRQRGMARIAKLSKEFPSIDLLDLEKGELLSEAFVDNIFESRRFRMGNSFEQNRTISKLHYFNHIPKTGGAYASRLLNKLTLGDPFLQRAVIRNQDRFGPCDVSSDQPTSTCSGEASGHVCTAWIGEETVTATLDFQHHYTVIRNPREHVLSQYFHCKESIEHKDRDQMPGLTSWLEAWTRKMQEDGSSEMGSEHDYAQSLYRCYDPRNMQSMFSGFSSFANEKTYNRTFAKQYLHDQFDVIGDTSRSTQAVCLIAIRYLGRVPPVCNCTHRFDKASSQRSHQKRVVQDRHNNHGVTHHGSTYKTTQEEDEMITRWDQRLYELALEVLDEQLAATEAEYGIKICPYEQLRLSKREVIQCDGAGLS